MSDNLVIVVRAFEHNGRAYTRGVSPKASEFGGDLDRYLEEGVLRKARDASGVVSPAPVATTNGGETQHVPSNPPATADDSPSLTGLDLSEADLKTLQDAGYVGRLPIASATDEELLALHGIGEGKLAKIREWVSGDAA